MIPSYPVYLNCQFLMPPELMTMPTYEGQARSQKKSSKMSSRKGSTDIDSKTKFKTEVKVVKYRFASIGRMGCSVLLEITY